MVEVKALYHFLDKNACRNRMQGEVFKTTEEYAGGTEAAWACCLHERTAEKG